MSVVDVSDKNFDEIEKSDIPVLADFYAEWCAPCKGLVPIVEKLSEEFDGQIKFAKVNVESAPNAAVRYNIASVPTVILFKNGEAHSKFLGLRHHDDYKEAIEDILKER